MKSLHIYENKAYGGGGGLGGGVRGEKTKYFGKGEKSCSSNKPGLLGWVVQGEYMNKGDPEDIIYTKRAKNTTESILMLSTLLCIVIES